MHTYVRSSFSMQTYIQYNNTHRTKTKRRAKCWPRCIPQPGGFPLNSWILATFQASLHLPIFGHAGAALKLKNYVNHSSEIATVVGSKAGFPLGAKYRMRDICVAKIE